MQGRMKQHQLSKIEIDDVLNKAEGGAVLLHTMKMSITYIVPVHFVVYDEVIYIHGLTEGQKKSNLRMTRSD